MPTGGRVKLIVPVRFYVRCLQNSDGLRRLGKKLRTANLNETARDCRDH
jgi:hypothetical protein